MHLQRCQIPPGHPTSVMKPPSTRPRLPKSLPIHQLGGSPLVYLSLWLLPCLGLLRLLQLLQQPRSSAGSPMQILAKPECTQGRQGVSSGLCTSVCLLSSVIWVTVGLPFLRLTLSACFCPATCSVTHACSGAYSGMAGHLDSRRQSRARGRLGSSGARDSSRTKGRKSQSKCPVSAPNQAKSQR